MYGNELTHYGVKGMKWGRRTGGKQTVKVKRSGSSDTDNGKAKTASDKTKRRIAVGKAAATTALVAYGAYTLYGASKGNLDAKRIQNINDTMRSINLDRIPSSGTYKVVKKVGGRIVLK